MSLINLLSLQDDEIDIATTAVRDWCSTHKTSIDSLHGRAAMTEVVRLIMAGERQPALLADALARHMRLEQFKHPGD
ncbi:hypothetical protein [Rhizobium sp. KDH_Rht_773_N]